MRGSSTTYGWRTNRPDTTYKTTPRCKEYSLGKILIRKSLYTQMASTCPMVLSSATPSSYVSSNFLWYYGISQKHSPALFHHQTNQSSPKSQQSLGIARLGVQSFCLMTFLILPTQLLAGPEREGLLLPSLLYIMYQWILLVTLE